MKFRLLPFPVITGLAACHGSGDASHAGPSPGVDAKATRKTSSIIGGKRHTHYAAGGQLYHLDTLKKEDGYVVLGDSLKQPDTDNLLIALKFKPYLQFADLPAAMMSSTTVSLRPSNIPPIGGPVSFEPLLPKHTTRKAATLAAITASFPGAAELPARQAF